MLEAQADLDSREPASPDLGAYHVGLGRELFGSFRACVTGAEEGAMSFGLPSPEEPFAHEPEMEPEPALVEADEGV